MPRMNGRPTGEVLARLERTIDPGFIFRTDEDGTVEFISDGSSLWLKLQKQPAKIQSE